MSDIAVSVRGLSKAYTITHEREKHSTLAETLLQRARNPFRRSKKETFWALKDVSFDIQKGDVVGIIGRNGAGKSTLLKILSRITEPTSGTINLYGRVGSLLEVGTGFHPELTGRENIYLNGQILGMRKKETIGLFDEIVEFAGVEKFLDTPVKRYSSGMYVRLAFAVAAHLRTEILIVDEVLAVGDAEFQRKCLGKMEAVAHDGRAVLLVSHNMAAVQHLCHKAIVMERGTNFGPVDIQEAIRRYSGEAGRGVWHNQAEIASGPTSALVRASVLQNGKEVATVGISRPISVFFELNAAGLQEELLFAIHISDAAGNVIYHSMDCFSSHTKHSHYVGHRSMEVPSYGLAVGTYKLSYWLGHPDRGISDHAPEILAFEVIADCPIMARYSASGWKGIVGPGLVRWEHRAGVG